MSIGLAAFAQNMYEKDTETRHVAIGRVYALRACERCGLLI